MQFTVQFTTRRGEKLVTIIRKVRVSKEDWLESSVQKIKKQLERAGGIKCSVGEVRRTR